MSAARVPGARCVNRNPTRVSRRHRANGLQRRVDRKALEAQLPAAADIGLDPTAGVTPNAGFTVRSHRRRPEMP